MNLNTPLEFGGTVYNGNIYVSPKGTMTFGQGDFTFWDFPQTPSISIASWDYHAFATGTHPWAANNDLYVRYGSTATSICVDWKVLPWGQSSGDPVYIRLIAEVNPVDYTWTPTYQVSSTAPSGARYGVRYTQGGEVFPLNIQTITEPPPPAPVVPPAPTPTPEPTPEPTPLFISTPNNIESELLNGSINLTWDEPQTSNTPVESYAIFWSYDNFETGFAISSTTTSATINNVSEDVTVWIKVRADNNTNSTYSNFSDTITVVIPPTPTPEPSPEPTPEEPTPSPTPSPEPSPEPTPEPTPSPVVPVEPVVPPANPVDPTPQPTQNPEPTMPPATQPVEPEQTMPPTEQPEESVEPSPEPTPSIIEPEEESIISAENLPVEISAEQLMQVDLDQIVATDLSDAQVEALIEAALEVFETAEPGSQEYSQALAALFLAASADDIVLDEALAAIPLLGDVLGGATELINFLGNAGADMSPQVREDSEKVVVTAIVAVQAALSAVSISGIATTVNLRNGA
jgi:hypothetical protein